LAQEHHGKANRLTKRTGALLQASYPAAPRAQVPEVVVISLKRRQQEKYVQDCLKALRANGYPASLMNAFEVTTESDKTQLQVFLDTHKIRPTRGLDVVVAMLASHFSVGMRSIQEARPLISLEDDTIPLRPWNIPQSVYADYDILCLHRRLDHGDDGGGHYTCKDNDPPHVKIGGMLQGKNSVCYGANALLFTGNRPEAMKKAMTNMDVNRPIDLWHGHLHTSGQLRVGALCPSTFEGHDGEFRKTDNCMPPHCGGGAVANPSGDGTVQPSERSRQGSIRGKKREWMVPSERSRQGGSWGKGGGWRLLHDHARQPGGPRQAVSLGHGQAVSLHEELKPGGAKHNTVHLVARGIRHLFMGAAEQEG
jgi:hypothetical protein